jgi:hypothetical protein
MAKSGGPAAPAKPSRADKKTARTAKRQSRRETWRNMRQAFSLTRQNDPKFLPYLILFAVLAAAVLYLAVFFVMGSAIVPIPFAVLAAVITAMFVFSRRAQRSMFTQAEGQQLRGDWRLTQAVAGTTQLDAVHRLVGRPGIVLVGEGAQHRVRGLMAQEKKKVSRISGDTPIYDVIVGTGEGELRLAKLSRYLLKLPTNLSKQEVSALDKRLAALGGARSPLPQGPLPPGAKMRNMQRTVRRKT